MKRLSDTNRGRLPDLPIGHKVGRWTINGPSRPGRRRYVPVVCECGTRKELDFYILRRGATQGCGGCASRSGRGRSLPEFAVGAVIGKWTVVGPEEVRRLKGGRASRFVPVRCACGAERFVRRANLKLGRSESCGCGLRKHAQTGTRLRGIHSGILQRCLNPRSTGYASYGGRGVRVAEEWLDFATFFAWAMSNGYDDDLTIDRIDPDWHYEPSNCQWITRAENARRVRRGIKLEPIA